MIIKHNSFADRNVILANRITFRKATGLESKLMNWAFDYSVYPERPAPWAEVVEIFHQYTPTQWEDGQRREEDCKVFVQAAKMAYRIESSLRVTEGLDLKYFVKNPLTLQIKFYSKNRREDFMAWSLYFGEMGRVHHAHYWGEKLGGRELS